MAVTYLVQNDDKPDLIFTITDSGGSAVDLSGSTVDFHFTEQGTSTLKNAGHTTCTLTDAANGVCKYEWGSGDLDTVGIFEGEVQVTYASSKVQTVYAKFDFEIRDELDT
jgi:hypothetical protein